MPGHNKDRFISGMGNKSVSGGSSTITRGNQNQRVMRATAGQFMFDDGTPVPAGTPYHMHPERGPMEGAQHNPNIPGGTSGHDFFDPVSGANTTYQVDNRVIDFFIPPMEMVDKPLL